MMVVIQHARGDSPLEAVQKVKRYLLFIAVLIGLVGCSTVNPEIPVGLYREHGKHNFIDVSSEKVRVHIAGVDERDKDGNGLTFSYALWSGGRLILQVARSAELMYGYPALDYHWDGGKIVATDLKSKLQWEFQK